MENTGKNNNPRYPIVTAVLYFGTTHWNKPTTIYECVADSLDEDMKPFVNDFKINLFEIAFLTEEQTAMFKSDFRIVADYFVQIRKNIPTDTQMKHVKEVLQLMSVLTHDNRFEEAADAVVEGDEPKNMCEVLDRVEQRGKEIGEMKKAKKAAANMKAKGYSTKEISEIVEVDIEIINSWFDENLVLA